MDIWYPVFAADRPDKYLEFGPFFEGHISERYAIKSTKRWIKGIVDLESGSMPHGAFSPHFDGSYELRQRLWNLVKTDATDADALYTSFTRGLFREPSVAWRHSSKQAEDQLLESCASRSIPHPVQACAKGFSLDGI